MVWLFVGGLCAFANWWILVGVVWCLSCVLLWIIAGGLFVLLVDLGYVWFGVLCVVVFCFVLLNLTLVG